MYTAKNFITPRRACAFVVVLTFLCFLPDLKNGLLYWDDDGYIRENPFIRTLSIETVSWAFTSFWCNFWAPLTWLSLALDFAIWGKNPIGYHLTNNILHALNAGLFFFLTLEILTSNQANDRTQPNKRANRYEFDPLWCSILAALFFALHPLRVESVAWATERKDLLSLFFGIPAIMAYIRHTNIRKHLSSLQDQQGISFLSSRYYWLSFAFFCLSLLSKPMLVTLPAVLLVLDWYPLKRIGTIGLSKLIAEKIPFFLVSGIVALISMSAQRPQMMTLDDTDVYSRILNAARSIVRYLWLTFWPAEISPFYLHPMQIHGLPLEYALSACCVIAVTIACLLLVRRYPLFLTVWLLYLITLFPILGFTQVGPQAMAARFTYAPSLPLTFLVALLASIVTFNKSVARASANIAAAITGSLLIACGYLTVRDISFWKDDITLWSRVINLDPTIGRAYSQRAHAYFMRGEYLSALGDINKNLDVAIQKNYPRLYEIYANRAQILAKTGAYNEAIDDYTRALTSDGVQNQSGILMARGELFQMTGNTRQAAEDFAMAAKLQPGLTQ